MSNVIPDKAETQQQQQRGTETFLSAEERKTMQRFLSHPEEFPKKFGSWITDYIAVNGLEIPASQLVGINQFRPQITIGSFSGATWTSYQDTGAPSVTFGPGTYLALYGWGQVTNAGSEGRVYLAPSINEDTPSDANAVVSESMATAGSDFNSGFRVFFKTFTVDKPSNSLKLMTRVSDGNFSGTNVWIILLKISN